MFMDSIDFKQQICCSFSRMGVGGGGMEVGASGSKKLVIFCRLHNFMTPNLKKSNIFSFGASVHVLVYVCSK